MCGLWTVNAYYFEIIVCNYNYHVCNYICPLFGNLKSGCISIVTVCIASYDSLIKLRSYLNFDACAFLPCMDEVCILYRNDNINN